MTCAAPPTFRLLDGYAGWDIASSDGLAGFGEGEAVELAAVGGGVDPAALISYLPPPRIVHGCAPCEHFLVTPEPDARVLRRDACTPGFVPVRGAAGAPGFLVAPVAIARRGHRTAVADPGANAVIVFSHDGERIVAIIPIANPHRVALGPHGEVVVVSVGATVANVFGPDGSPRTPWKAALPSGAIDRIGIGEDCALWVVTETPATALDGTPALALHLWRAAREDVAFAPASPADLAEVFAPTHVTTADATGFCLDATAADGTHVETCWDWRGQPLTTVAPLLPAMREPRGQLLTVAIDSGIPRCRWHRIRVEAEVPFGTKLEIAIATSEAEFPVPQGDPLAEPLAWQAFPAGVPHPDDWQIGSLDFLVEQPAGRCAFLRVRLSGDRRATPRVRRVRLDMPRVTSLELLPAVYRESPEAEDFGERFLSLFDASTAELDRAIERAPALLDVAGVPGGALAWLAGFFDIAFDPAWSTARRRALLRAAPEIFRRRGTVAGLRQVISILFDADPVIDELSLGRMLGALDRSARLRATRLASPRRARMLLDRSELGRAPLLSWGNPTQDPYATTAFRFRVLVPPTLDAGPGRQAAVERLVASQKPAHTLAHVRVGGGGFLVGIWSAVGVDTVPAAPARPILGALGNVRLRRASVVWPGRGGTRTGLRVGLSAVGDRTRLQ
ncbi:MAG: phage tail protein [Kofleriaceae bacterium]